MNRFHLMRILRRLINDFLYRQRTKGRNDRNRR